MFVRGQKQRDKQGSEIVEGRNINLGKESVAFMAS